MSKKNNNETGAICLDENQKQINQFTAAVPATLPFMTAVYEAYQAINDLPELDTETFHALFSDLDSTIDNLIDQWYRAKYLTAHQAIGMPKETGLGLVTKPDFTQLIEAIKVYQSVLSDNRPHSIAHVGNKYFFITADGVAVDQDLVNQDAEAMKFYITTDRQKQLYAALQTLAGALVAVDTILRPKGINLIIETTHPHIPGAPLAGDLSKIFEAKFDPRFDTEIKLKPSANFFRSYK